MTIQRGDVVKFRTMGANPNVLMGEVIHFIPRRENVYDNAYINMTLHNLPKKRRRFKEVNTKNDRYLVAVYRKGVSGNLINSVDYYAPFAERVDKV